MSGVYDHLTGDRAGHATPAGREPARSKAKKHKSKELSFCQRLVERLDPPVAKDPRKRRKRTPTPPILKLPTELRQQLLHNTLEDDYILHSDLNEQTATLSAVCHTFRQEMSWILEQWMARHQELNTTYRSTFGSLIDDLMSAAGIDRPPFRVQLKYQSHNKRARDFAPRSHEVGVLASSMTADDRVNGEDAGTEQFAAMQKWKKAWLKGRRREVRARNAGDWDKLARLRKQAELEKKNMKFKRLSFLAPDQQDHLPNLHIFGIGDAETGHFVEERSTDKRLKQPRKQRRKYDEKRRALENEERMVLKREAKRQARWVEEHSLDRGQGSANRGASKANSSIACKHASALDGNDTEAASLSKEERKARSKARKQAGRQRKIERRREANIRREEEMQQAWKAHNPEAAEKTEALMLLKWAYGRTGWRTRIGRIVSGAEGMEAT